MTFRRETLEEIRGRRVAEREAHFRALAIRPAYTPQVSYVGGAGAAHPKTQAHRNTVLLEMANGRPCLLCLPGRCSCTHGSTVACHSNFGIHGKAKNRRADDQYTVWGGDKAHRLLDQPIGHGGMTKAQKLEWFMAAHLRQVVEWRRIVADPAEQERYRQAARWALDMLNATPVGEIDERT